jgi:DNA helicase-4
MFGSDEKRSTFSRGASKPIDPNQWRREHNAELQAAEQSWRSSWERDVNRERWIPQSVAHRIAREHPLPQSLYGRFRVPRGFGLSATTRVDEKAGVDELLQEFAAHNIAHLAAKKAELKAFFDTVEASPLTDEQADACICMDDAVQIVAAAGSGKTSTMVAKTGYVLHQGLATPEQILLLAFNTDAADELRQRVRERLKGIDGIERVTVKTFHAFGRDVITAKQGPKPAVARWVGNRRQENEMIVRIVEDLRARDPGFGIEWDLFRTVFGRPIGRAADLIESRDTGRGNIRTAAGDWVKSQEERLIADWLFYHGVKYEYERDYQHDTRTATHQQYRPDFYYPDAKLYHEHFAIGRDDMPPPHFTGDYVAGVAWKRECHAEHETDLFVTTSHGGRRGVAFHELAEALKARGVDPVYDASRPAKGEPPMDTLALANLVRGFQQHVKGGGATVADIRRRIDEFDEDAHSARSLRFLSLYERIADEWERRLRDASCIDFDDMLVEAATLIEAGAYDSPYTMIFADEFQDSSRARVRLLKVLLERTDQLGHLCVVGDDWQSINRFAGADLTVMTDFAGTFPHSSQLRMATTFRCPQSLCDASGAFVSANPRQMEKTVQTTNAWEGAALLAFAFDSSEQALKGVETHLKLLHGQVQKGVVDRAKMRRITVMLLGRYNHDEPEKEINSWRRQFGDEIDIGFRTVHSAKGLEADYVLILNMIEDNFGFPSQIADDPVLVLAMPGGEDFPMAEERRVFYVAMTRARRQVRIYTKSSAPSRFLIEMAGQGLIELQLDDGGQLQPCPKCRKGVLTQRSGTYGAFESCGVCDFKRNLAEGAPHRPGNRVRLTTPMVAGDTCPTCTIGRMMERAKARYGPMVGCSGYPDCKTTAPLRRAIDQARHDS